MLIREAKQSDAACIARVQIDVWRTTYKGILPDSYLTSLDCEKKARRWQQILEPNESDFAFVAENKDGQIVGFASAGRNQDSDRDFAGELYTIYLLENYQRYGIGKLLVSAVAKRFIEQEIFSMLLWVLAENQFRAFYESLGGERVAEKEVVIGDSPLVEIAYGWNDLETLLARQI